MKIEHNVSAQVVSWVKSNREGLQESLIENLYYPENVDELKSLLERFSANNESFDIIGCSSNTLFLPTYQKKHLICTKLVNQWHEFSDEITCSCGTLVNDLAKKMVDKGFVGFEGLIDLPGTIAAGVYGNCGCRGCSILGLVKRFTLFTPEGVVKECSVSELDADYRTTNLKRKKLKGVILQVVLRKVSGNREQLLKKAEEHHEIRKRMQPSAANNLGTTFIGKNYSLKGNIVFFVSRLLNHFVYRRNGRESFYLIMKLLGKSKYIPYVFSWNRYMFLDKKAHELFSSYVDFLKTLFKDLRLEIEIRK